VNPPADATPEQVAAALVRHSAPLPVVAESATEVKRQIVPVVEVADNAEDDDDEAEPLFAGPKY